MDAVTTPPPPINEPVEQYAPGSPERAAIVAQLETFSAQGAMDLPCVIDGEERFGGGDPIPVVQPQAHAEVLGTLGNATTDDALAAVQAAQRAAPEWRALSFDDRAAILLKAADLLAGPWRPVLNGATMLGQSKTVYQAEIDSACELIDFWRFNVHFARQILAEQPISSRGVWNRADHRPLEGFVYAITPFNFTAIAGNLPTAPALMGNTVVWKPAPTQQFAAHYLMKLLEAAGLPPGVINMVTGDGLAVSEVALANPDLAGIHFTGSTPVFQSLWRSVGERIGEYRHYPRLVGETGGKDFILAHPSADPQVLITAMIRGAFEFQGQKCSAASRAYVPQSLWEEIRSDFIDQVEGISQGSVTDMHNFMSAVIDRKSFDKNVAAIERARADGNVEIVAGGTYDDAVGYFIRPTVLLGGDPTAEYFTTEYFGPILAVHVYDDADFDSVMAQMENVAPYALTGSILATDRRIIARATEVLRFAAGNFYINDKPTGAVVGQQPFGGGRASGTNDKAGAMQNLLRWSSTRALKETFDPPTSYGYPFMQ